MGWKAARLTDEVKDLGANLDSILEGCEEKRVERESERTTSGQVVCWDLEAAIHEVSTESDFLPPRLVGERNTFLPLPSTVLLPPSSNLSRHLTASRLEINLLGHPYSSPYTS
jgi:hypothetical protein